MCRRGLHRTQYDEVETELCRALELLLVVTRRRAPTHVRPGIEQHEPSSRKMNTVSAAFACELKVGIHDHLRTPGLATLNHDGGQCSETLAWHLLLPHHHEPQAARQCSVEPRQEIGFAALLRIADGKDRRELECTQDRTVRRQDRRHADVGYALPAERLHFP